MHLTLQIPVKPHIKKYLLKKYGQHYKMNKRDALSITLFNMLRQPSTDARTSDRLKKCTESFSIQINGFDFFNRGCRKLEDYTVNQFNAYVHDSIKTELFGFVENAETLGLEQKEAIAYFMTKYGWDETDIKFDTLKKAYTRYKEEQELMGEQKINGFAFVPLICALKVLSTRKSTKIVTKNVY